MSSFLLFLAIINISTDKTQISLGKVMQAVKASWCPLSDWQHSISGLIWSLCERPTHLIIPQPDQDDVRRVNPDLEENKTKQGWVAQGHAALCDPRTRWRRLPEKTLTRRHTTGFPLCVCACDGGRRRQKVLGSFLPSSGVFLWCGKAAWFHRSTSPPDVRSPTF